MPEIIPPASPAVISAAPLTNAEQESWRLTNHGLAWAMLGVILLSLAGFAVLLGQSLEIVASSTNSNLWGFGSPGAGKQLLVIKVLYGVSSVAILLGMVALSIGLSLSGAFSPARPARWLSFLTLAAGYGAIYGVVQAIFWFQAGKDFQSRVNNPYGAVQVRTANDAEMQVAASICLGLLGFILLLVLGQTLLLSLALAWKDQQLIRRIKWYLKSLFALPGLLVVTAIFCGILLPSAVAILLIVVATLAGYVYLAWLLLRNIYLLHRTILRQLEPELFQAPPPPPPKPVIDPLAD